MREPMQIEIDIDAVCVHDEMVDGKLDLFLCLFNCEDDVPENWFDTPDFIDLKHHFSIELIVESIIGNHGLWGYDSIVFDTRQKPIVDQLIEQFEQGLARLRSITFTGEDK